MQVELTDLQPVLAEAQVATDKLMEEIEAKLPGVREQEEVVGAEAAVAQKEADAVQVEVDAVQADLDEALPALESAVQALNTINDKDIDAVRKLSKPPATVKLAEGVCVMLGEKPVKIPDPDDSSKKIMDYWAPSQKMMGDKGFIPRLKEYDKDNIPAKVHKDDVHAEREVQRGGISAKGGAFTSFKRLVSISRCRESFFGAVRTALTEMLPAQVPHEKCRCRSLQVGVGHGCLRPGADSA